MLQIEIIGNLGQDAEIKEFNGQRFISFSVAHTESYTDAHGERQKRTVWVSCLKYGESGVINYLKKGTSVFVRGDLSVKMFSANGTLQAGINCRVMDLQLLGRNKQEQGQTSAAPAPPAPSYQQPTEEGDDLPF
ncbi:MAG: single-stranded DNA-binding protein [Clostridia bacterium]|nr:single-stranded DNA-binding protein [Clostridia bacterium]